MIEISVTSRTPITSRTRQISAMLDVPVTEEISRTWRHELPLQAKPWSVGLVVGPSGAGKSLLANKLWGDAVVSGFTWKQGAIVDDFPETMGIREISAMLSAVGLGTVPAWLRPYSTLSNGEAFRADMARALAEGTELVVIDEFTSVVDRQIAQVASHTVQKTVRATGRRFVAVTCHYDVEDWLQPDWVYDVAAQVFTWRLVQPHPPINLEIHQCPRSLWAVFAPHHYLSHDLLASAKCFAAYVGERPVAFMSYRHFPHPRTKNLKMGHRHVVLPDWQGLGIVGRLNDWLGLRLFERGYRYRNTIAHPAMIRGFATSPRWREVTPSSKSLVTSTKNASLASGNADPRRLSTRSFEYVAPAGTRWASIKETV